MRRIALVLLLLAALALAGCGAREELQPPATEEILATMTAVLGAGRADAAALPLAVRVVSEDEPAYFRRANEDERARLWLPEPMEAFEIKAMRSKSFPSWRILFYSLRGGEPIAPWVVTLVEIEGQLSVVLLERPTIRLDDGTLRPDVRPNLGRGAMAADESMTVAVLPAWDSQ